MDASGIIPKPDTEISQKFSVMEDRVKLMGIVAALAARLRLRFLHFKDKGHSNWLFIEDDNRAAHDGNLVVHVALSRFRKWRQSFSKSGSWESRKGVTSREEEATVEVSRGEEVMVIFVKDKERQIRDGFYCNAPLDV
jgi:hypothetical protein